MKLVVFSSSTSFEKFLSGHLDQPLEFCAQLQAPEPDPETVYLLHLSSMQQAGYGWLKQYAYAKPIKAGVCSDLPNIREMLETVRVGARAYCNSRMAEANYQQMLQLLSNGQSWFPPQMLAETFKLAHQAANPQPVNSLDMLTAREREIALAVGDGKSNREIAAEYDISERTVKTHLTNIFKKLELKDRVSLVLYLKQA